MSDGSTPAGTGDLAIVLHSHMPYVEGFGTYPFGEEWLFDAVVRSHLPVLEVARDLTMSVTPVLADQLEADGVAERLEEFLRDHRLGAARRDVETADPDHVPAAQAEVDRYERASALLERSGGSPLAAFAAARDRGVSLIPSSATHAVLPLLATRAGLDVQVEAGLASHQRRFGPSSGFWLPECAYRPGLENSLDRHGIEWFCVDQSRHESGDEALAPIGTAAGQLAFTIDWPAIAWLWDMSGYPSWSGYLDFHRLSMNGLRIFRIDGGPYDPEAAARRTAEQAEEFLDSVRQRLEGYRDRTGNRGLLTFAIDCELLGHWWSEGPSWLARVLDLAAEKEIRLVTLDTAADEHRQTARSAELKASTWGEDKDFRTWDSPAVADLAWASRSLEMRVAEAVRQLPRDRAERAVRELLMVQSSDWAFLDQRGQAGDYPFERATAHAENAFEALESGSTNSGVPVLRQLRGLAPNLSLTPFLIP
jgi:1,4-alpha-glucan branching enzyme